jgi:hypothetical protein
LTWCDAENLGPDQRIPLMRCVRGPLDIAAAVRAVGKLHRDHEILRTRYFRSGTEYRQVVTNAATDPDVPVEDLRSLSADTQDSYIWSALDTLYRSELRLDEQMLTMKLVRLADDHHYFVGMIPHIAMDALSARIFWRELFENYDAYISGREAEKQPNRIQYADFALWEQALLEQDPDASRSFWAARLANFAPLNIPSGRPRDHGLSPLGFVPLALRNDRFSAIAAFARQSGVTMATLILGCLGAVLSHWTRRSQVAFGIVVHGRPPAVEQVMGCFVQLRPFAIDLSDDPTFDELMAIAREAFIAANDLRRPCPRELMSDLNLNAFVVNLLNTHRRVVPTSQISLSQGALSRPLVTQVCRDMKLDLFLSEAALLGSVVYASDHFQPIQIRGFTKTLIDLIASGILNPGWRLSRLFPD